MPACPVVVCGDLIPAKDGIFDRHPELTDITGFRLQFIPHSMRGRNDKKSEFSTFYEFINFSFSKFE